MNPEQCAATTTTVSRRGSSEDRENCSLELEYSHRPEGEVQGPCDLAVAL